MYSELAAGAPMSHGGHHYHHYQRHPHVTILTSAAGTAVLFVVFAAAVSLLRYGKKKHVVAPSSSTSSPSSSLAGREGWRLERKRSRVTEEGQEETRSFSTGDLSLVMEPEERPRKQVVTMSLRDVVLWSPSPNPAHPLYAWVEHSPQLLRQLAQRFDLCLIMHVESAEERKQVLELFENSGLLKIPGSWDLESEGICGKEKQAKVERDYDDEHDGSDEGRRCGLASWLRLLGFGPIPSGPPTPPPSPPTSLASPSPPLVTPPLSPHQLVFTRTPAEKYHILSLLSPNIHIEASRPFISRYGQLLAIPSVVFIEKRRQTFEGGDEQRGCGTSTPSSTTSPKPGSGRKVKQRKRAGSGKEHERTSSSGASRRSSVAVQPVDSATALRSNAASSRPPPSVATTTSLGSPSAQKSRASRPSISGSTLPGLLSASSNLEVVPSLEDSTLIKTLLPPPAAPDSPLTRLRKSYPCSFSSSSSSSSGSSLCVSSHRNMRAPLWPDLVKHRRPPQ